VLERARDVEQVVVDWLRAKQMGDSQRISGALSSDDPVLAIGTEAAEWYAGVTSFAEAHASAPPFTAVIEQVEAYADGPLAWAAVRAVVQTDEPGGLLVRLTLVLAKKNGSWRIVHSHASIGAAR
jgi:ketosteroid isomerase-like protein